MLIDLTNSNENLGEDIKLMAVSYLLNVVRNKYNKSAELGMHPDDRQYIRESIFDSIAVTFEKVKIR